MVQGLVPTMLVGMLGALIAELIRLVPALRAGRPPQRLEYLASVIMVVLGAGAALLGWDTPQPAYKVAVLGAAFPLLFTASVSALTPPQQTTGGARVAATDGAQAGTPPDGTPGRPSTAPGSTGAPGKVPAQPDDQPVEAVKRARKVYEPEPPTPTVRPRRTPAEYLSSRF